MLSFMVLKPETKDNIRTVAMLLFYILAERNCFIENYTFFRGSNTINHFDRFNKMLLLSFPRHKSNRQSCFYYSIYDVIRNSVRGAFSDKMSVKLFMNIGQLFENLNKDKHTHHQDIIHLLSFAMKGNWTRISTTRRHFSLRSPIIVP